MVEVRIEVTVDVINGTEFHSIPYDLSSTDDLNVIKSKIITDRNIENPRLFFRNVEIADNSNSETNGIVHGDRIMCVSSRKRVASNDISPISNLQINDKVVVKIVDHYREKGIFLVSDPYANGVPVCFLQNRAENLERGVVVAATYRGAKLKKGSRLDYLVLEGAVVDPPASFSALAKPVCLLMQRSEQVWPGSITAFRSRAVPN